MDRTLPKIERLAKIIAIIFVCLEATIFLGAIINLIEYGDAVVGLATIMLAYGTFYLAFTEMEEGITNREHDKAEAKKDRRRLRLKEQLEGFYTPIINIGKANFILWSYHRHATSLVRIKMIELRQKYKFLASDEIMEIFDEYYHMQDAYTDDNIPSEDWIMAFWERIKEDFDRLYQEYSDLTKPIRA